MLEGSHKQFEDFWKEHPEEYQESLKSGGYLRLKPHHVEWMWSRGCVSRRVPVPKGGLVLWDSRQVHANANPVKGRKHPDRLVGGSLIPTGWGGGERERERERYV